MRSVVRIKGWKAHQTRSPMARTSYLCPTIVTLVMVIGTEQVLNVKTLSFEMHSGGLFVVQTAS
jgi:hypothetical protein